MSAVTDILAVGAGSCAGGIARFLTGRLFALNSAASASLFPWSTFTVNVAGSLIIGIIYGLIDRGTTLTDAWRLFLTVGFCGGFTTFSTFMHENMLLFGRGNFAMLLLYAAASFAAGLAMVYAGHWLARSI